MRLRHFRGPLVVVLWQVAPITARQDSLGNIRLSLGYGRGEYQDVEASCSEGIRSHPVDVAVAGARVDYWPSPRFRVTGAGGAMALGEPPSPGRTDRNTFFGAQAAYEGRSGGIGLGLTRLPEPYTASVGPSLYLRAGNLDRIHARLDVLPPSEWLGTAGLFQAGIAFNKGHLRGPSAYAGVSQCVSCWANADLMGGLFVEGGVPLGSVIEATVHGRVGWPYPNPDSTVWISAWSVGVGLRFNLGAPARSRASPSTGESLRR